MFSLAHACLCLQCVMGRQRRRWRRRIVGRRRRKSVFLQRATQQQHSCRCRLRSELTSITSTSTENVEHEANTPVSVDKMTRDSSSQKHTPHKTKPKMTSVSSMHDYRDWTYWDWFPGGCGCISSDPFVDYLFSVLMFYCISWLCYIKTLGFQRKYELDCFQVFLYSSGNDEANNGWTDLAFHWRNTTTTATIKRKLMTTYFDIS